jgi:O-acetyl-ADP-ribose deacetylase (regulator of RNase III)
MPHYCDVALLFSAFANFVLMSEKIFLIQGDITKQKVDAIVNAANSSLMGGGGVDGAIHRAGGPAILEDCRKIIARQGSCKTGEAVITTAGNLPAKFVIHTVGPVWNNGNNNEAEKLANCYMNSLHLALENKLESIAFPNISTGIYGYPKKEAATIAIKTVSDLLQQNPSLPKVHFVCFDEENYSIYKSILASKIFPSA